MDQPVSLARRRIHLAQCASFALGTATIDPAAHEAIVGARREHIQPQAMKVLVALHQRLGEVVGRNQLIERCWDGRIVGEDVINRCISLLRGFASRAGGFAIETVPKAGYRLVETSNRSSRRSASWSLAALTIAAIAALLLWMQPREPPSLEAPTVALKRFTSGADGASRDLAAASGEALSHMLLAGTHAPRLDWPATAEDESSADFVLAGDVRKISDGFNVVVQLRDRATGTVMFSRQYSVSAAESASLPERIGAEMSSNVSGALAMLVLDRQRPVDAELAADFLKQIAMIVQGSDPLDSYQVSRKMAAKYPGAALPQLALAFSTGFAIGSLPRDQREKAARDGRIAANEALRLRPQFGDSYAPWCFLHSQARIGECENRLRAGMKADPNAPYLPAFLSDVMLSAGRHDDGLKLARATLSDQPYQPHKLRRVILLLLMLGHKEDGEELYSRARRWWPEHPNIYGDRLKGYALAGDIGGLRRAADETPDWVSHLDRTEVEAISDAWRGGDGAALGKVCASTRLGYVGRLACVGALAKTGDKDSAFAIAGTLAPTLLAGSAAGNEQTFLDDPYAGVDPLLSAPAMRWLRSDPRYLALAKRVGLLAYWRSGRLPDFCRGTAEPVCEHLRRSR